MRLVSYQADGDLRPGVVVDNDVFDVERLIDANDLGDPRATARSLRKLLETHGADLPALSRRLEASMSDDARAGSLSDLRLGPPVPDPSKILCIGINYRDHAAETGRALPEHPDVFAKFPTTLIGPSDDIAVSLVTAKLDYEGELAVVVGRHCRHVPRDEALHAVCGATILNDVTARDLQFNGTQWLPGKAVDASTPCGPVLVTLDELGDPQDLELSTRVNGAEVQHANTGLMIFTIAEIVAYISRFLALRPGDLITTGTPDGVGSRRDPPRWLAAGDCVEVEVDGIGVLKNTIR